MDAEQHEQQPAEELGPQAFRDSVGRVWDVSVNVTTVKRARRLLKIDIPALLNEKAKPLGELLADDCRLVDLLYVLCMDQAQALKISDEDFGRAMLGDSILHGRNAFLESFRFFLRDPRLRDALSKVIATAKNAENRMLERLATEAAEIDPDKAAATLVDKLIAKLTSVPGSSASTPAPIPTSS